MIFTLFLTFFYIGLVSFGGGYGMLALMRETVVNNGWLTDADFASFVAVSESTPGPIAINMATLVGSNQAGIWGSVFATLGVVMPSFIIILIIASLVNNLTKYPSVQGVMSGVKPCVVGLILGTGVIMAISTLAGVSVIGDTINIGYREVIVLALNIITYFGYKAIAKKNVSPIILILVSAVAGIILWQ